MKICIFCRYEVWTKDGKQFCNWFFHSGPFDTNEKAETMIKVHKEGIKEIDKSTKLKHEYKIREVSDEEWEAMHYIAPKQKRGRPKKEVVETKKEEL